VSQRFGLYSKRLFSVYVIILNALKQGGVIQIQQAQMKKFWNVQINSRLVRFYKIENVFSICFIENLGK